MEPGCRIPLDHFRQTLQSDPQDVVAKALLHHRFDLWYGSHYLRFTQALGSDRALLLRLEERARLADGPCADPGLFTAGQLPSLFVYEETVPELSTAPVGTTGAPASKLCAADGGRRFFDRAARLLDTWDMRS
jgi:hypothetical protein